MVGIRALRCYGPQLKRKSLAIREVRYSRDSLCYKFLFISLPEQRGQQYNAASAGSVLFLLLCSVLGWFIHGNNGHLRDHSFQLTEEVIYRFLCSFSEKNTTSFLFIVFGKNIIMIQIKIGSGREEDTLERLVFSPRAN